MTSPSTGRPHDPSDDDDVTILSDEEWHHIQHRLELSSGQGGCGGRWDRKAVSGLVMPPPVTQLRARHGSLPSAVHRRLILTNAAIDFLIWSLQLVVVVVTEVVSRSKIGVGGMVSQGHPEGQLRA